MAVRAGLRTSIEIRIKLNGLQAIKDVLKLVEEIQKTFTSVNQVIIEVNS